MRTLRSPKRPARTTTSIAVAIVALAFGGTGAASPAKEPARLVVTVGTSGIYGRPELRPGERVVCRYRGHTLSVHSPTGSQQGSGTVWPKPGTTVEGIFHLNVNVVAGKAYAVTCGLGGYHSALVTR
jgi:hypothetical protein